MRMEWDWVDDYPIFVYMAFIDHSKWDVKVVKGVKGNQNVSGYGPTAPAWFEYTSTKCSRRDVAKEAFKIARGRLQ